MPKTTTTLVANAMWAATAHHAAVPRLSLNTTTDPIRLNPTINLGFPKSGTSSLYDYYSCGNVVSSHHKCKLETCGECVFANVEAGRPPLDSCGNYAFYGQLDVDGMNYDSEGNWPGEGTLCYFPQLSALQELHDAYPTARFTLTTRPPAHWLASVVGWGLQERLVDCDLPGLPKGKGTEDELMAWFSGHLDTVREFVAAHPSHGPLLEIDIEDDSTGQVLAEATGIVRRAPAACLRPPCMCTHLVPTRAPPRGSRPRAGASPTAPQAVSSGRSSTGSRSSTRSRSLSGPGRSARREESLGGCTSRRSAHRGRKEKKGGRGRGRRGPFPRFLAQFDFARCIAYTITT